MQNEALTVHELFGAMTDQTMVLFAVCLGASLAVGAVSILFRSKGKLRIAFRLSNMNLGVGLSLLALELAIVLYQIFVMRGNPLASVDIFLLAGPPVYVIAAAAITSQMFPLHWLPVVQRIKALFAGMICIGIIFYILSKTRFVFLFFGSAAGAVFFFLLLLGAAYYFVHRFINGPDPTERLNDSETQRLRDILNS